MSGGEHNDRALLVLLVFVVCSSTGLGCSESDAPMNADAGVSAMDAGALPPDAGDPRCLPSAADPNLSAPPDGTEPCEAPSFWPAQLASDRHPFTVHYRPGEEALACQVRDLLDISWGVEVDQLGFRPPLSDNGSCGSDDRFDVFIWVGIEESYVSAWDENLSTTWDDRLTYMVVDPLGPYGGDILHATLAHELNHAMQAADDWWETPIAFEMTATFMEEVVFGDDDSWHKLLVDFQSRPDWSIDRNDDYQTWYMYSAALYLEFLRQYAFGGDASFVSQMWLNSRNPPGAENDPSQNEPDYEDALDVLLQNARGLTFVESVPVFARWRWYTGVRDDGQHFAEGARYPADALVPMAASVTTNAGRVDIDPAPMVLGSAYVAVSGPAGGAFDLTLDGSSQVEWVIQAVPGQDASSDGEVIDLSGGSARVALTQNGTRTVIITALPIGAYDPDTRTDARYNVAVEISPAL